MRAARPGRRRRASGLARGAGVAALATTLGVVGASAAPVGTVTSAQFTAWNPSGSALLLAEAFDGTDGAGLDGAVTDHPGQAWSQIGGTWTIQGNAAASTSTQASSLHAATGTPHHVLEVKVTVGATFDTGIFVNGNSTRSQGVVLAYTHGAGGQLTLWGRRSGGPAGDWLAASGGGLGVNGTFTLKLESGADNVVRGYHNGVEVVSYAFHGGDIAMYKASTHEYVGLWAWFDSGTRYDDAHATRSMPG